MWGQGVKRNVYGSVMAALLLLGGLPATVFGAAERTDSFWHNLLLRSYDYYIPDSVKSDAPLLMIFHGWGADSDRLYPAPSVLSRLADEQGFVIMWMESGAWPMKSWNAGPCCFPATQLNIDDDGYVMEALQRIRGHVAIDDTRVYVLGHSNGASMSHRLALQRSNVFAAILPISFPLIDNWSWRIPASWKPTRSVPVLAMHAVDDPLIQYDGRVFVGGDMTYPLLWLDSAPTGRDTWARLDGCSGMPEKVYHPSGRGAYSETYRNCRQGTTVGLLTFPQGGHRPWYPDDRDGLTGNGGVDVQREAWNFLTQFRKPGHKSDRLWSAQELAAGQYLVADGANARLDVQGDGNLVLRNPRTGVVVWSSGTAGSGAGRLVLQQDGNLVLWRDGYWSVKWLVPVWNEPRAVWASNTAGSQGESRLQVNDSGRLQILRNGVEVWGRG